MEAVQAQRMREHTAGQIHLGGGEGSPPAQACHLPPTWDRTPGPLGSFSKQSLRLTSCDAGEDWGGGGKDQEQTQGREETSSP